MLSERQVAILKSIVESFIANAEPVGSKSLVEKFNLPYSSALVRSEMVALEEAGYIEKTHTSSGRVPSALGYRYYVENLMEERHDDKLELMLNAVFSDREIKIEEVIRQSCDILSQMTNLTSMVLGPEANTQTLQHINLFSLDRNQAVAVFITNTGHSENKLFSFDQEVSVDELNNCCLILNERLVGVKLSEIPEILPLLKPILAQSVKQYEIIFQAFFNAFLKFANQNFYLSGANNLFDKPEFTDVNKLRQLIAMFENSVMWKDVGTDASALKLTHSEHASLVWKDDLTFITSNFKLDGDNSGQLMVVGPSRMEYDRVVALMEFMSKAIEKVYGNGETDE